MPRPSAMARGGGGGGGGLAGSLLRAAAMAAGAVGLVTLALAAGQSSLIYHPRRYDGAGGAARYYAARERGTQRLTFETAQGRQAAFYLPPAEAGAAPDRLWVLMGGNAMLALDWRDTVDEFRGRAGGEARRAGFLMVDYPGYGACEGSPGPDAIAEQVERAVAEAERAAGAPSPRLGVVAHSLGCAVALRFVADSEAGARADRAVLMSPFSSLLETAQHHLSWVPLMPLLLRHRYDNTAAAARLAASRGAAGGPGLDVTVVHGARDRIVPVRMGKALAATLRERAAEGAAGSVRVEYVHLPHANHNNIFDAGAGHVFAAMAGRASL